MSRRKDTRRPRPELKLHLEPLETRRLLSADAREPRPEQASAPLAKALESLLATRSDAASFAQELVQHPRLAGDVGLGALSTALREHTGYAARHGWGATLAMELHRHPRYAAKHHLTALMKAPRSTSPVVTHVTSIATPPVTSTTVAASTPVATTPAAPPIVAQDPQTVAIGGYLDVGLPNLGLGTTGVTYTITPQPLPANMTFNRGTGELVFAPAPGQAGTYDFSVAVTNGSRSGTVILPVTVTNPAVPSTEVSGQVVDQNGNPLADMPVTIGTATTYTNQQGDFTLAGIPANPGPISAGGALATAEGRLALTAPVPQLLGHSLYMGVKNTIPAPLIVPTINWSSSASFDQSSATQSLNITNPAMPGFNIQVPANATSGATPTAGTVQVAELMGKAAAEHETPGVSGPLLLLQVQGAALTGPVQLTMPNTGGFAPGAVLTLYMFNPLTGGHDAVGRMVVSPNGQTMTSTGPVTLSKVQSGAVSGAGGSPGGVQPDFSSNDTVDCLGVQPSSWYGLPYSNCDGCQSTAKGTTKGANAKGATDHALSASGADSQSAGMTPGAVTGSGDFGGGGYSGSGSGGYSGSGSGGYSGSGSGGYSGSGSGGYSGIQPGIMDSNAGLVTGEYFLNNQLVSYQSQGQQVGIDLQYSSAQADPTPVVQYQFTTPPDGDSSDITSITAQVTLAGVLQGDPVTYNTPDGLTDGDTYNIPLQVDASELTTGVYSYTMTITENFGSGCDATSITTENDGEVNVVNESSDPYGAGWSIGGLQQISQVATNGPVLITAGQQGTEQFNATYTEGQSYIQDLAVVDGTQSAQILANDGTGTYPAPSLAGLGMQLPLSEDVSSVATASGVFTSNGLPDLAVIGTDSLSILLNNGSGGFTDGAYYDLPSGYVATAVAVGNFSGHTNGTLDIAVLMISTSNDEYDVAEYTGNGNGTFESPVISAAGNGDTSDTAVHSMVAADFNGDGLTDLAFATENGLADVMLATGSGDFGSATSLSLPSGHDAAGVAVVDDIGNSYPDLVVEAANTNLEDSAGAFAALDLFSNNGSGSFSFTSTYQTVGHVDGDVMGLVAGDFQGSAIGPELAVPLAGDNSGGGVGTYLDVVPLSTSATWGSALLFSLSSDVTGSTGTGNIVVADLNGSGKPSIVVSTAYDGDSELAIFLADPASNQLLPTEILTSTAESDEYPPPVYQVAVAPFMDVAAEPTYVGPTSDPSTLVQNSDGTWTRTYPDGIVIQFNSSGQEVSETDANSNTFTYTYVTSGALATITDPVGLVTTLAYDSSGYLSTITNPAGRVTTFTISDGNLTEIEDSDDATWQYGYNSAHEATSETDPNDNTATADYNSFGQLTSETLFDGTSTTSIDAAQSNGLLAPGDEGALPTAAEGSVTDPDGRTTTLAFNWMGHPTGETAPNGGSTSATYNRDGYPVTETDAMGRTTTYTYNSEGDVTSITEFELEPGQLMGTTLTETIQYNDPYGVPTEITDFDGNVTTFVLDSHGNVLEEEQPGGVDQEWTYNSAGQVLTSTDADDNTTTYTYNSLGRLTTITEPLPGSPTIEYTYDQAGDVTSVTDATGDTTTYTYNQMGQVLTEENPVQAAAGKDVSFTYDPDGNLLTVTDALGNTTTYTYNARNERTSVTDPMGRTTSYAYDAVGNLVAVTDPLGNTTSYTYTSENQVQTVTDPTGGVTTYTYDLDGEETSVTDPNDYETTYTYDSLGRLAGVSEPEEVGLGYIEEVPVATYTYNGDGDLLTDTDGDDKVTTYTYNSINEETAVKNANGDTTQYTYTDDGEILTVTNGLGYATTYTYDALGNELTVTQPSGGGTTTMTYDAAGDLLSVEDPDDNVTSYTYTAAHQVATETTPTGGVYTYTYDLNGNLIQSVDPDDHTITYTYNADNEVTSETWVNPQGGTPLDVFNYTYNDDGELTSVSDDNSAYQYTYNADGEETSQADVGSPDLPTVTLTYSYDPDGNRTSMDDSLGGLVTYTYDARNELTSMTFSGTDITDEAVKFTYDNEGNMTGLTRYSNLSETTVVASTSYTYDAANQMTGIVDKNSSGTTLVSYGYTYDAAARVTQEVRVWDSGDETDTLTYDYTDNNQLTSVTHSNDSFADESFTWDANGNETGTGYTTSTGNEQTASPGYTYTYDADGNMITSTQTSTGDVWTYSYNFAGQMTGAVETNSDDTVIAQVTYTYDALGNRIGIDDNGTQTWTLYDTSSQVKGSKTSSSNSSTQATPIMDFDGSRSLTMRYLNGPAGDLVDTVLSRESYSGTVAWYLPDRLGTIRDLINNSGSIIDHLDYSAFGTVLDESDPSAGDRMMGFAGMERDTVTGLNLAVHRVQNPATGRWTIPDPKGFAALDANLFRYVTNNPTSDSDPTGYGFWGGVGGFLGSTIIYVGGTIVVAGSMPVTAPIAVGIVGVGLLGAMAGSSASGSTSSSQYYQGLGIGGLVGLLCLRMSPIKRPLPDPPGWKRHPPHRPVHPPRIRF